VAAPTVIEKELLVAVVRPLLVADTVYVPTLPTILQPAKVATPLEAATGLVVQVSVAPLPGCVAIASATDADDVVTVLPPLSSTVTTGCCVQVAALALEPLGCVVNTSCVAAPTLIEKVVLVALGSPLLAADIE